MRIPPFKMKINKILILVFTLTCLSCNSDDNLPETNTDSDDPTEEPVEEPTDDDSPDDDSPDAPISERPNILLIIPDDMGIDATVGYELGAIKPNMPNLEQLISNGITFNNLWSSPECTPTRAGILTGKYGFRTNVIEVGDVLSTAETSIQSYLDTNTNEMYSHAVIGKWHVSNSLSHPTDMGVGYYAGHTGGGVSDYFNWDLVENGSVSSETTYITTKLTDLAIDWVNDQSQPWFLWLAYNAPHVPFHVPPADLHSQGALAADQASINANSLPYYIAAIEAMDTEMGRLLSSMSQEERDNTIIIFAGDNGTPNQVRQEYANRRVKGSIYQGGVNVPLVVSGATINRVGQTEDALIGTPDLFATIADIAGAGTTTINDSKSFKSLFNSSGADAREFVYSEVGDDAGGVDFTIRNETHKYLSFSDGSEELYNLSVDPLEVSDLLANGTAALSTADSLELEKLLAELARIQL